MRETGRPGDRRHPSGGAGRISPHRVRDGFQGLDVASKPCKSIDNLKALAFAMPRSANARTREATMNQRSCQRTLLSLPCPVQCLILSGLVIGLSFTGCGRGAGSDDDGLRVAMIPKGTSHVFWKSVHAGAVKAQRELEAAGTVVDLVWKGPLKEDDRSAQISVVENFMSQQVDGIALAPLDDVALIAPVERATRSGVPVVIFDSGLNSDQIVSFVATDNFRGGQRAGEYLGTLLEGKGKVILLRYMEGSASTQKREAGFLDAIGKYPDIEIISDNIYAGATRATAQESSENLLNRFGADVDGIFCPNESSTVGMLLALRRYGRGGGDVKFVGFDGGDQNMEALRAGDIQGLILQDPFNMGYLALTITVQNVQGEAVETRIDTGSTLITLENVDEPAMQALINPPLDQYLN